MVLRLLKTQNFQIIINIKKEINKIIDEANSLSCKLITTEKDFLRLEKDFVNKIKFVKSELKIIDEENFIKAII